MALRCCRRASGFTLIELMIVVTILAILAALLIPALGKAQARAMTERCKGAMKGIGTAIRTYSITWEGWTPTNANAYISLMGQPARLLGNGQQNPKWNANTAKQVKDFRCPADSSPMLTSEGYYSSYVATMVGENLMSVMNPSSTLMAVEIGSRHPTKDGTQSFNLCYADGHMGLAADAGLSNYVPAIASGAIYYLWYSTNATALYNKLKVTDMPWNDTDVTSATLMEYGAFTTGDAYWCCWNWGWFNTWRLKTTYPPNNASPWPSLGGNGALRNFVMRVDGYINFDRTDDWTDKRNHYVNLCGCSSSWQWFDTNENGKIDGGEAGVNFNTNEFTAKKGAMLRTILVNYSTNFDPRQVIRVYSRTQAGGWTGQWYPAFTQWKYNPAAFYVPAAP